MNEVLLFQELEGLETARYSLDSTDPLLSGIANLLLFVQLNWTGPSIEVKTGECSLSVCGEHPHPSVKGGYLLERALNLLKPFGWWYVRALFVHQKILDNPVADLRDKILSNFGDSLNWAQWIEAALINSYYGMEVEAMDALSRASQMLGFKYKLEGVLGKRMKHQQNEVTQLVVHTNKSKAAQEEIGPDDDLIERPEFIRTVNEIPYAAILMAHASILDRSSAKDASLSEHVLAFCEACLDCSAWAIQSSALFLRSLHECTKGRLIERAALQLHALSDQVLNTSGNEVRLNSIFISSLPPVWEILRHEGRLFAGLGAFKTAFQIFQNAALWEDAINCLVQLGEKEKAEHLIAEQLKKAEGSLAGTLLCILGDLRQDPEFYTQAWNQYRSGRSRRALGRLAFKAQNYELAIEHFSSSLSLNPLFPNTWFLYGCSLMQLERWREAGVAFTRLLQQTQDNSDAWCNLAICHQNCQNFAESLSCLKEAAKLSWDNLRVWESLARTALHQNDYSALLQAAERIADLEPSTSLISLARKLFLLDEDVSEQLLSLLQSKYKYTSTYEFNLLMADWQELRQNNPSQFLWRAYRILKELPFEREKHLADILESVLKRIAVYEDVKDEMSMFQQRINPK